MNFPYKIIFSDLDMTLLNLKAQLSELTLKVLNRALERGIKICLVSGRSPSGIRLISKHLSKPVAMAACNGAIVIDEMDKGVLHSVSFSQEESLNILHYIRQLNLQGSIIVYSGNDWYCEDLEEEHIKKDIDYVGVDPVIVDFEEALQGGLPVNKFMFLASFRDIDYLEKFLKEKMTQSSVSISKSSPMSLDVVPSGINKAEAAKIICKHYGIELQEAIAFGDSPNDVELLACVGLGVAVENAHESVKKVSKVVIGHHDEDGVARFLEELGVR